MRKRVSEKYFKRCLPGIKEISSILQKSDAKDTVIREILYETTTDEYFIRKEICFSSQSRNYSIWKMDAAAALEWLKSVNTQTTIINRLQSIYAIDMQIDKMEKELVKKKKKDKMAKITKSTNKRPRQPKKYKGVSQKGFFLNHCF